MATISPRVGFTLAGDGGAGEGGDDLVDVTAHISNNYSLIDKLLGIVRFTTAAGKPTTNNYEGKIAQEIDNGNLFIYDGAQWQILPGTVFNCTSATRPTAGSYTLYDGLQIFETDTKILRIYSTILSRWQWIGGAKEVRQVTLPLKAGTIGGYATFPITAGGTIAAQTNDPDSCFIIDTSVGAEGIKVRDAGFYRASIYVASSANNADAIVAIFIGGSAPYISYKFGPSGAIQGVSIPCKCAANDVFVPKVYTYSGAQNQNGWMTVEKMSEL